MAMLKAWGADPRTGVQSVAKNCFLVQFYDPLDMETALTTGPWTFRGDLVAFHSVTSHEELQPSTVRFAQLWVQLFNLPINAFSDEGILLVAQKVGTPLSMPFEGYVGGKRFTKVKVQVDLSKPLRDTVPVTHQFLGEIKVYCVYEKVARVCLFCYRLGHDLSTCPDHSRLSILM